MRIMLYLGSGWKNIFKFYKDPVFKQIHLEYTLAYNIAVYSFKVLNRGNSNEKNYGYQMVFK